MSNPVAHTIASSSISPADVTMPFSVMRLMSQVYSALGACRASRYPSPGDRRGQPTRQLGMNFLISSGSLPRRSDMIRVHCSVTAA